MKYERKNLPDRHHRSFRAGRLLGALFCLLPFAAASAAEPPAKTFELTITRSAAPVKPRVLRVQKDDHVRIRITSDGAGEIHLHGYRLEMNLTPGTPHELAFKARATGRYRIEWHAADEAAQSSDHHGPPVAVLEVRPQ